jgi:hypothetical protein
MGLEMFLDKQHCVANWKRRTPDKKRAVLITRGGKVFLFGSVIANCSRYPAEKPHY